MTALIKALSKLPMPLLYLLGNLLRVLAFNLIGYRRKVIDKNLRIMFPDADESEYQRIKRAFHHNFSDAAVETLKGFSMSAEQIRERVSLENPELLEPYLAREQSLLILTPHQANLEWVAARICLALPCPVAGVYKPLHNPLMDTLIREGRARFGNPVPINRAAREVLRQRKSFRAMLLVADQSPISRDKRFWHPFFTRPAPFYFGPQTIAEAGNSVVVFAHPRRIRRGYYSIRWEILAEPPYPEGETAILERFVQACERSVREQPESWWLSNKKWKSPKPWEHDVFSQAQERASQ